MDLPDPTKTADHDHDSGPMRALGRALAVLRVRAGLSQSQAGARLGVTGQGWSKYENGMARSIFQPSVQARLAESVGASRADLLEEAARANPKPADEDWHSREFLDAGDAA